MEGHHPHTHAGECRHAGKHARAADCSGEVVNTKAVWAAPPARKLTQAGLTYRINIHSRINMLSAPDVL
jgi:hypothetical protein